jgi:hypothetical protein
VAGRDYDEIIGANRGDRPVGGRDYRDINLTEGRATGEIFDVDEVQRPAPVVMLGPNRQLWCRA